MEPKDVLPELVGGSGKSMMSLSLALGRSRNYITQLIQQGSISQVDTVADVADVCGYDLVLRRRSDGEEMLIDPPSKDD